MNQVLAPKQVGEEEDPSITLERQLHSGEIVSWKDCEEGQVVFCVQDSEFQPLLNFKNT